MPDKEDIEIAQRIFKALDAAIAKILKEDLIDLKHDNNFVYSVSLGLITIGLSYIDEHIDSKKYFETLDKIIGFYKSTIHSIENKKLSGHLNDLSSSKKEEINFTPHFSMNPPKKSGPNTLN